MQLEAAKKFTAEYAEGGREKLKTTSLTESPILLYIYTRNLHDIRNKRMRITVELIKELLAIEKEIAKDIENLLRKVEK